MDFKEADRRIHEAAGRVLAAPLNQQAKCIAEEVKKFPVPYQQNAKTFIGYVVGQGRMRIIMEIEKHRRSIKWVGIITGIVALALLVILAVVIPNPTPFQYLVFRVVLSLGAAGFAGALTGFLQIEGKVGAWAVAAGGGFGMFLIIFLWNPPILPALK